MAVRHLVALALALACGLALRPGRAAAEEPSLQRLTADRVEATPSVLPGMVRLRVYVSAIDLATAGSVIPMGGGTLLELQGAALKRVPHLLGGYAAVEDAELALVVVLQVSGDLGADVEVLKDAIRDELLAKLPGAAQVAVIGYADDVVAGKLTDPKKAIEQLERLEAEPAPSPAPAMLRALDRALRLLRRPRPLGEGASGDAIRKVVVLVGDGRDAEEDKNRVTRMGQQADKHGVRIHTVAYSPGDDRRPLFALGELSKQSQGTFRWVKQRIDAGSLRTPFRKLAEELERQYVLTVFVPEEDVPRKLSVAARGPRIAGDGLRSGDAKVPSPACGEEECRPGQYCVANACVTRATGGGRGVLGWVLLVGGIAVGALAALVGVGFVITKVRERRAPAPPPGAPAPVVAPGAAPVLAPPAPVVAPGVAPAAGAPAPAVPPGGPCLLVLSGPLQGQRIPLHHGFRLGKAPDCHLSLAHDGFASGHHAQILMDGNGTCELVDQGSTNGTFANGVRVTSTRLYDGMSIRCGSTELRFLQG